MIVEEMEPMTYKRWADGHWFRGVRFDTAAEMRAAEHGWNLAQEANGEESKRYAAQIDHEFAARVEAETAARKRTIAELGGRFRSVLMELEQIMIVADIEHYDRPSKRHTVQLRLPDEARRAISDFITGSGIAEAVWSTPHTIICSNIEVTFGPPWDWDE